MMSAADATDSSHHTLEKVEADYALQIQYVVHPETTARLQLGASDELYVAAVQDAHNLEMSARDIQNVANALLAGSCRVLDLANDELAEVQRQVTLQGKAVTYDRTTRRAQEARHKRGRQVRQS